uniref:Leucyl/phenylalanyl-tRNA protein transferase n=1 Tax=Trypanosoma congolense (strain IL3000) TaxID=1068625 RepID=G0UNW9_TRYCI|nr:conserved hypothetical protein [Trypanosoma congolense IL3000]
MAMSFKVVPSMNYADIFGSQPFSISSCEVAEESVEVTSHQKFPVTAKCVSEGDGLKYFATVWALFPGQAYKLGVVLHEDGESDVCADEKSLGAVCSRCFVHFRTLVCNDLYIIPPSFIFVHSVLLRKDFLDCVLSQCTDYMAIKLSPSSLPEVFFWLFYHSLFVLPIHGRLLFCALPNYVEGRYCIDLEERNCPWLRSKKVRRVIASGLYAVAVNRDIGDSLKLAKRYHTNLRKDTWLIDDYITILIHMANNAQLNVRVAAVELVEKSSGCVMAGCLGFSVGALFHDFTMFTIKRSTESFGTAITKVMGSALQECGYNMWYWGTRVDYMKQYERGYGGRCIPKKEFLQRWERYREERPRFAVEEYLQSGRGALAPWEMMTQEVCSTPGE